MDGAALLGPGDPEPVMVEPGAPDSPFLLTCDHAGAAIPARLGDLGLTPEQLADHIAIDVGALPLARALRRELAGTLVAQAYSRLVIDCNRQPHARDSIAEVSDGVVVPANAAVSADDRARRVAEILEPYQGRIAAERTHRAGTAFCIVCVHSFTPALASRPTDRPWRLGVIFGADDRLGRALLEALAPHAKALRLGVNEPYAVDMANDYTVPLQCEAAGVPYVELEFRNDTIGDPAERERLARLVAEALRTAWDRLMESAR